MNKFVTSDLHFFHKKALEIWPNTRRGSCIEEMHELMIDAWNEDVKPEDHVYVVGDFSFSKSVEKNTQILKRLNGQKTMIRGNHDYFLNKIDWSEFFVQVKERKHLYVNTTLVVMDHYPIESWEDMHLGSIHLHGHEHGRIVSTDRRRIDVGIDARPDNLMKPWSLDEVVERALQLPIKQRW